MDYFPLGDRFNPTGFIDHMWYAGDGYAGQFGDIIHRYFAFSHRFGALHKNVCPNVFMEYIIGLRAVKSLSFPRPGYYREPAPESRENSGMIHRSSKPMNSVATRICSRFMANEFAD